MNSKLKLGVLLGFSLICIAHAPTPVKAATWDGRIDDLLRWCAPGFESCMNWAVDRFEECLEDTNYGAIVDELNACLETHDPSCNWSAIESMANDPEIGECFTQAGQDTLHCLRNYCPRRYLTP